MTRKKTNHFGKAKLIFLGLFITLIAFLAFVEVEAPTEEITVEIPLDNVSSN